MRSFAFPSFAAVRAMGSLWQGQANAPAAESAALEATRATAAGLKAPGRNVAGAPTGADGGGGVDVRAQPSQYQVVVRVVL